MDAIEEDIDENDLLHDLYDEDEQNIESTRLSEMVNKEIIFLKNYNEKKNFIYDYRYVNSISSIWKGN